jgi:hypothetical protein
MCKSNKEVPDMRALDRLQAQKTRNWKEEFKYDAVSPAVRTVLVEAAAPAARLLLCPCIHPVHPPRASTPCIHPVHPPRASTPCIHALPRVSTWRLRRHSCVWQQVGP